MNMLGNGDMNTFNRSFSQKRLIRKNVYLYEPVQPKYIE